MVIKLKMLLLTVYILAVVNSANSLSLKVDQSNTELPVGIYSSASVYDGLDSVYILGGRNTVTGLPAGIFKYTISQDTVEKIGDTGGLFAGSGVWTGENEIYYIGHDNYDYSGVWKMDPTDLENRISVQNLTSSIYDNAVVWDGGEFIYSFGGYETLDVTLKYSRVTNAVTEYENLPLGGRYHSSAVWDNVQNKAYIFGGYDFARSGSSDDILEFDPVSNTVTKLNTSLSSETGSSCAVWTGTHAYIIGGLAINDSSRFTPSKETVEPIDLDVSYRLTSHSCVFAATLNRIYIFGGQGSNANKISYIDLPVDETPTTTTIEPSTTTTPSDGSTLCKDQEDGVLLPDPECCKGYYICFNQLPLIQSCPAGQQFHPILKKCDDKAVVNCGNYYYHF